MPGGSNHPGSIYPGDRHHTRSPVRAWSRQTTYDAVLASSSGVAGYLFPPCVIADTKRWVDLIDVDSQKWLDYATAASFPMSLVYRTEVRALHAVNGIEVTGSVPDVRPWLLQSTCAVVPLRIARGVQNKVLEAMACGRPVICSPEPFKGLAAEPGVHLLRADSAVEWITALSRVFDDKQLQLELGRAAADWVRQHYSWSSALTLLNEL